MHFKDRSDFECLRSVRLWRAAWQGSRRVGLSWCQTQQECCHFSCRDLPKGYKPGIGYARGRVQLYLMGTHFTLYMTWDIRKVFFPLTLIYSEHILPGQRKSQSWLQMELLNPTLCTPRVVSYRVLKGAEYLLGTLWPSVQVNMSSV